MWTSRKWPGRRNHGNTRGEKLQALIRVDTQTPQSETEIHYRFRNQSPAADRPHVQYPCTVRGSVAPWTDRRTSSLRKWFKGCGSTDIIIWSSTEEHGPDETGSLEQEVEVELHRRRRLEYQWAAVSLGERRRWNVGPRNQTPIYKPFMWIWTTTWLSSLSYKLQSSALLLPPPLPPSF